jgi:hypothetical protein
LLHYRSEDPLTHASLWNKPLAALGPRAYADSIDRWLAYYREQRIDGISFGAVILQGDATHSGVIRRDPLKIGQKSAGPQIERIFSAAKDLGRGRNQSVLDRRFALAEGTRLEQSLTRTDSGWEQGATTLRVTEGIGFEGALDTTMTQVLLALDGERTGRDAATSVAAALGLEGDTEIVELTEAMIVELYSLGLLMPADT